jgi:hypothetical protein
MGKSTVSQIIRRLNRDHPELADKGARGDLPPRTLFPQKSRHAAYA